MPISEKSRLILEAIAKGHTYEQILVQDLAWTYHDIFQAAAEALGSHPTANEDKSYSVEEIRHDFPRAYEKWSAEEDKRLRALFGDGKDVKEIAMTLHRQAGAIRSRLAKLNLIAPQAG
jgi:DNA-directed RNA polymerase specialized sigma24 family protein